MPEPLHCRSNPVLDPGHGTINVLLNSESTWLKINEISLILENNTYVYTQRKTYKVNVYKTYTYREK